MTDSGTDEFPLPPEAGPPAGGSPLQLIEGEFCRPRISFLYRTSLIIVSAAMILLPIVYLAVIAIAAYGVFLYATNFSGILDWVAYGRIGVLLIFFAYFVPLFIGITLVFFLVKPLFAPRPPRDEPISLNHADAPQLFALIGWICRSLDAPIPSRVDVCHNVNAGAEIRSIFGNDIVLELGLTLAAGMNLEQFAGVIAHEYGHFSQGGAMRARHIIFRINSWFYRAVYDRDRWDAALVAMSEQESQPLSSMCAGYLARAGIWLGRRVPWLLLWIGHALFTHLGRQMEFNADQYEISFVGSETFIQGLRRSRQLQLGEGVAMKRLRDHWNKKQKLFDQIPDFIVSCANEVTAESQDRLHTAISKRGTHFFDSHPSDTERIDRAVAARHPGVFHSAAPATTLFANFPELARRATLIIYQSVLGPGFNADSLISTEQTVRQAEYDLAADRQNVQRYFLDVATSLRPMIIAETKTMSVRHSEDLASAIRSHRDAMKQLLPGAQAAFVSFQDADARLLQTCQAAHLLQAGFPFDPAEFNLADCDIERAQSELGQALRFAGADLFHFEEAAHARMADTVLLLRLSKATTVIPDVRRLEEQARELIFVLSRLGPVFEPLLELRKDCAALEMLLEYRRRASADNITAALEDLSASIQERVNLIQKQTAQIRYPFDHPGEQIMVSQFLRNTEYHADAFELTLREGRSHVDKIFALHQRLLSHLVLICEYVEYHAVP